MKKIALFILALVAIYLIFLRHNKVEHPQNTLGITKIIAGTTADFPPFSFRDQSDTIVGFDIDVAQAVAQRLNKKIEFKDMAFDSLIPQLKTGNIHLIAAGLSATPERQKNVLFTKPYLSGNPLLVVTPSNSAINKIEQLKNKEILVNTGYLGDMYMSSFPGITLKRVNSIADAFLFLKNKQADALVGAYQSIKPFLDKFGAANFKTFIIDETDENSSLAVSPLYPYLLKDVQQVLDEMETDGTLAALKHKWDIA